MGQSYNRRISLTIDINGKTVQNSVKAIRGEMQHLINSQAKMTIGSKEYVKASRDIASLNGILKQHRETIGQLQTPLQKVIGFAKGLLPAFGAAALIGGIKSIFTNVIQVRKEFEKYEAVLTNSLGSNKAARKEMQMLQDFAAETPFALTELTGAFVKLTNYGLQPTREEMRKYGDIASSVGKGFDQFAEAMADAATGEFERLKEFGIKAKKEGDKITFTFKEQSTVVDNNATSIKNYISGLGDLQGVSGSMAAIAETLGGKMSNMGDAWDGLMNTLGAGSSGVMVTVITWMTSFVNMLDGAFKSIEQIKQAVSDGIVGDGVKNGIDEINTITNRLIQTGTARSDAEKKARELYFESIDGQITKAKELAHSLDEIDREKGYKMLDQLEGEREGVTAHYKKLDEIQSKVNGEILQKQQKERQEYAEKMSKSLSDFLEKDAIAQRDAINKYFKETGEGAFDAFMAAIEEKQKSKTVDFSLIPDMPEETDQQEPTLDYAVQKYQESVEYQLLLNETLHENGLRGEQEYQDELSRLTKAGEDDRSAIKEGSIQKAQQFAQLGASFVSALMDMELAAAGENEEKKAAIRKKYARVQFLVSASQIIVDTASAIMKALAQLGPIAGTIAAGIIGATGAAQLGTAYAQMSAVKGYESGGFTNGDRIYRAGEDGKEEWIAPNWMLKHPATANLIADMERWRQNPVTVSSGAIETSRQFSGSMSRSTTAPNAATNREIIVQTSNDPELKKVLEENTKAIKSILVWKPSISIEMYERKREMWDYINKHRGLQ